MHFSKRRQEQSLCTLALCLLTLGASALDSRCLAVSCSLGGVNCRRRMAALCQGQWVHTHPGNHRAQLMWQMMHGNRGKHLPYCKPSVLLNHTHYKRKRYLCVCYFPLFLFQSMSLSSRIDRRIIPG